MQVPVPRDMLFETKSALVMEFGLFITDSFFRTKFAKYIFPSGPNCKVPPLASVEGMALSEAFTLKVKRSY